MKGLVLCGIFLAVACQYAGLDYELPPTMAEGRGAANEVCNAISDDDAARGCYEDIPANCPDEGWWHAQRWQCATDEECRAEAWGRLRNAGYDGSACMEE